MREADKNRGENARMRGESLKKLRERNHWTGPELARRMGTSKQMIHKHESAARGITADWLERYARAYGMSLSDFVREIETIENATESMQTNVLTSLRGQGDIDPNRVEIDPLGKSKMPVYASAAGGSGEMLFDTTPIAYVTKPKPLEDVLQAYGVYVVGDSMVPAYRPGDMLLVDPTRPPRAGDRVLIVLQRTDGWNEAIVKEFISRDDRLVRVRQFNPSREYTIPANTVTSVHLIVGTFTA